jgi:hypothetical protein
MRMVIDLRERRQLLPTQWPGGLCNFISFDRLVAQLHAAGEFKPDEVVTHLKIDDTGITYRVERK